MAGTTNDTTLISTTSSPFEAWLDFSQLRTSSIEYLAKLTGKVWTDYNLHDPGITILEMLCYAVMDLGYRASLPINQILAPQPGAAATAGGSPPADTNFYTPAQILACNPLTILDYRRLLVDIEGVTNAWIEVAQDQKDICVKGDAAPAGCLTFLNGLYHVYLQPDADISTAKEQEDLVARVKQALMAHRNFCEDFVDINILCTLGIGVCADIELEAGADAATVFQGIVTALEAFFSTAPKFYTLQELLQPPKCKSIDSIFAGRPYDLGASHGFVDPDEFEQITLRREIHVSDLYRVVLAVSGVATIRRLTLQICGNNPVAAGTGWVFSVPKNYVPVFNLACCGWQFTQNNRTVQVDLASLSAPFNFGYTAAAKILYPKGSPYLDLAIQYGSYLPGLGDYYSIQNEFPRVYGIGEGGLPGDSPTVRKAQALQLKGYLLFFDQMLADYAVQLQNIRSLFSLTAPAAADQHTYFTNAPATVPGIDSLISAGATATARAIAVGSELLHKLRMTEDGKMGDAAFAALSRPYAFDTVDERDIAVWQLVDDVAGESAKMDTFSTGSGCWYFYVAGNDPVVILLGRNGYGNQQDALNAGNLLLSSAGQKTNYSLFNLPDGLHFSFSAGVDIPGYYNYLQTIAEDPTLYTERRGQFLDHLLARFAEQFSDMAILSFGFSKSPALDKEIITAKERFLGNYVDLSSNRGKGADYSVNGWWNDNVSGFGKRVAALGGMNAGGNHSLCNFVVEQREDRYIIRIIIDGQLLFIADEKLYSRETTCQSAMELFRCAADFGNYRVSYDEGVLRFGVKLYYQNKEAWCGPRFDTHAAALEHAQDVYALFAPTQCGTVVSLSVYRVVITDHAGAEVGVYGEVYRTKADAEAFLDQAAGHIMAGDWESWAAGYARFKNIHVYREGPACFVDLGGFRFVPDDTIVDKVGVLTYRLVDGALRFKLLSASEFHSEEAAREDYYRLIRLLGTRANIVPIYDKRMEGYQLHVMDGEKEVAATSAFYPSLNAADAMRDGMSHYAARHLFYMDMPERPYRWKYAFGLGFAGYGRFALRSKAEYASPAAALEAAKGEGTPEAVAAGVDALLDAGELQGFEGATKKDMGPLLRLRYDVRRLSASTDPADFSGFVENETLSKELKYIYRLVDKDHLHGVYLPADYGNAADACATKKGLFQSQPPYETIDFCLGGDIIRERVDPVTGNVFYHFQLKLTRCSDPGLHGLVLFESVQGYASAADAQAAFDINYMVILRKALDPSHYGIDRYISTEEVFIHTVGKCVMLRSVVFVSGEAKKRIPWYHIGQLIDKIVALSKFYPIRLITDGKSDRQEFHRRFPCFTLPPLPDGSCTCSTPPVIHTYYFYVLCDTAGNEVWQSVWPVSALQAARAGFEFFTLLLRYPGNYLAERDHCTCRWRIFIREVLAESTRRFATRQDAWGPEGIGKFICVAQTAEAFHLYHNRKTCCDSFYVACPHPLLLHPCHYDTAEARDNAIDRMFQAFSDFSTRNLPDLFFPHENNLIYDLEGKAVALFDNMDVGRDFAVYCCKLLELVHAILGGAAFERIGEGCVIRNERGQVIAHALDPEICLEAWKRRMQQLAWYFPIVREKGEAGKDRFCIEIRLPCFNDTGDDIADDHACGCSGWKGKPDAGCWVAWKSHCCYDTCQKAFTDYFMLSAVLAERRNYRPIDDCPCRSYRIVLHQPSDIVAFNPQCYLTPDMDCDAAARARALINAEGLHTVEHILLRPRTQEDCRCEELSRACPSKTDCHFSWSPPPGDDPCAVDEVICFDPGADPYSFIATVAMPAWPQRFRSKDNRAYIEYMLAREAPAHVQLRVLWLAPHDLCCFEAHYREWLRWLACKQGCCEEGYTPCRFIEFLFRTRFECLAECKECPPCTTPKPSPCFESKGEQMDPVGEYTLLHQIDELYCWQQMDCKEYRWTECQACEECGCEEAAVEAAGDGAGEDEVAGEAAGEAAAAVAGEDEVAAGVETANEAAGEAAAGVETAVPDERQRRRFINARHADYKNRREALERKAGDNETLGKAKKFLAAKEVTAERFSKLIDRILEEKTVWKKELAAIVSCDFLDMMALRGVKVEDAAVGAVFDRMRAAGIDTASLFESWGAGLWPGYMSSAEFAHLRSVVLNKG